MFTSLLIGTDQGVAVVEVDLDGCRVVHRDIAGSQIGCVAADETLALAGTHDDGLMRSLDGGRAWRSVPGQQIPHGRVTAVAVGPGSDGRRAYAGTEPSHLYVSGDRGDSWHELDALQRIPSRSEWSFPPRPWTHHVRTIAPHPRDPSLLLAGIELGGLMHSADAGASWQDHRQGAHRDTHEVVWDEHGRWCVQAAGTGAARCDDPGGDDWRDQTDGLEEKYVWSAAISSHAAGRWYVAAARGPRCAHVDERDALAVIEGRDAAGSWERIDPASADGSDRRMSVMPYALVAPPGELELVAGLRDGSLLAWAEDGSLHRHEPGLPPITSMAVLAG